MEEILHSVTLTKLRLGPARFAFPLGSGNVNQWIAFALMNHDLISESKKKFIT